MFEHSGGLWFNFLKYSFHTVNHCKKIGWRIRNGRYVSFFRGSSLHRHFLWPSMRLEQVRTFLSPFLSQVISPLPLYRPIPLEFIEEKPFVFIADCFCKSSTWGLIKTDIVKRMKLESIANRSSRLWLRSVSQVRERVGRGHLSREGVFTEDMDLKLPYTDLPFHARVHERP